MHRVAFGLVVVALGAALLLVGEHSSRSTQVATTTIRPAVRPAAVSGLRTSSQRSPTLDARRQTRHFLIAFLSYEVGAGGSRTERAIRADASHGFAAELLAHPPTPSGTAAPPPARITRMRADPMPGRPDLALVSGEARRAAGPEPFAFIFARRHGRWLAVAPGE